MTLLGFSGLVNFITCSSIAIFVIFRNIKNPLNISFFNLNFSVALYSFGYFFWQLAKTENQALFWFKILTIGIILINITYLYFVFHFLGLIDKKRKLLRALTFINFIFIGLNLSSNLYTHLEQRYNLGFWPVPTILFHIYLIFWFWQCLYGFYWLLKGLRLYTGIKREQVKYFAISALLGFAGGATNWPMWYNIHLPPYLNITISLYIGIVAYAIFRYRLLDINLALTRVGIFVIVYLLVLGIPLGLAGWGKVWLQGVFGLNWYWAPIILAIVLATAGPFIFLFLQRRAESRLLKQRRLRQDKLRQLSSYMMRFTRLKLLASLIVHNVLKILQLKHTALYLLEVDPNKPKQYNLISSYGLPQKLALPLGIPLDSALVRELTRTKTALELEQIKHRAAEASNNSSWHYLLEELTLLKAHIVIPTFLRFQLMGFLILGESRNQEVLTQEDISVLQVLSNQAALAIENSLFWQKEQERLIEESREDASQAVSFGAGHQFNNRLYAISMTADSFLEPLSDKDLNLLSPEELKENLKKAVAKFKKISDECQFGGQITAGLMSLTGSSSSNNFSEFDPLALINSCLDLVEMKHSRDKAEANRPAVLIQKHIPDNLPLVFGSSAQIRDCLFNLIDNAYDAIYAKDQKLKQNDPELTSNSNQPYNPRIDITTSIKDNYLVIDITDNGLGIREEHKKRLFAGFFTTKPTSVKGYGPGGHGIGLFTVRRLILAHKGKIYFNSTYGQGTTFTIELPLAKKKGANNV